MHEKNNQKYGWVDDALNYVDENFQIQQKFCKEKKKDK